MFIRTFGNDERLELVLLRCTQHAPCDLALDRVSADQPEDKHRLRLPDRMCPILRPQVHFFLWVLRSSIVSALNTSIETTTHNPGRRTQLYLPR